MFLRMIPPVSRRVAAVQIIAQAEQLHFLGVFLAGADDAQIIQFAAHRRDLVRQRIAQEGEMAFAHERRHNADHQKQEQPGRVENHADGKRNQGDGLQQQPPHGIQHSDAIRGLLARALQNVVKAGIFKRRQVQPGGMPDQAQAHLARKLVGQAGVGVVDGSAQHQIRGRQHKFRSQQPPHLTGHGG